MTVLMMRRRRGRWVAQCAPGAPCCGAPVAPVPLAHKEPAVELLAELVLVYQCSHTCASLATSGHRSFRLNGASQPSTRAAQRNVRGAVHRPHRRGELAMGCQNEDVILVQRAGPRGGPPPTPWPPYCSNSATPIVQCSNGTLTRPLPPTARLDHPIPPAVRLGIYGISTTQPQRRRLNHHHHHHHHHIIINNISPLSTGSGKGWAYLTPSTPTASPHRHPDAQMANQTIPLLPCPTDYAHRNLPRPTDCPHSISSRLGERARAVHKEIAPGSVGHLEHGGAVVPGSASL